MFVRIFHNFQSTSAPGSNSVSSTVFSLLWVVSSMEPSARSDLARFICFLCRDWCKNIDQLEKLLSGLQLISILQISLVIYPYPSISGSHSWSNIVCVLLVCFSNDQEKYFLADEGKWRCLASYHTNKNVHLMQYLCTPPPFHCKISFKVPKKWFIINCSVNR